MGLAQLEGIAISRRRLLVVTGVAGVGLAMREVKFARAQATPMSSPVAADLSGYPELTVTITDDAVTLSPDSIPAGYILMTVVNNSSSGTDSGGSSIVAPPADMSAEDFLAQAQATPAPDSNAFLPAVAYTAKVLGGPGNIDPGQTGQAILEVAEGTWYVTGANSQPFATLTVTAGTPTAQAGPAATVTVREVDFKFNVPSTVKAGKQIWRVTNGGTQPHMFVVWRLPDGATVDQLTALIQGFMTGTPAAGALDASTITDAGGVDLQSAGTVVYPIMNLEAGTYGAICFVPDPKNNYVPHAMEGMITVFQVN